MLRRNITHAGKNAFEDESEWRRSDSPDKISIDPLMDRSETSKKGVIPKLYL